MVVRTGREAVDFVRCEVQQPEQAAELSMSVFAQEQRMYRLEAAGLDVSDVVYLINIAYCQALMVQVHEMKFGTPEYDHFAHSLSCVACKDALFFVEDAIDEACEELGISAELVTH